MMCTPPDTVTIADVAGKAAISPEIARHLFDPPIGRNQFYGMIERGEVPSRRIGGDEDGKGGRILIPVAPLLALFGISLESLRNGGAFEADSAAPITCTDCRHADGRAGTGNLTSLPTARTRGSASLPPAS